METIFKVGMEVYDQIFFGKTPLKITEVKEDETLRVLCGEVTYCYTGDGRFIGEYTNSNRNRCLSEIPTLSTSHYVLQGFEQKAPIPTYSSVMAENLKKGIYVSILNEIELPDEKTACAFEALAKLIWLRDYYNEGWQPDWNDGKDKYAIVFYKDRVYDITNDYYSSVLSFKNRKIRDKFLEEQKELLEIAKPLF